METVAIVMVTITNVLVGLRLFLVVIITGETTEQKPFFKKRGFQDLRVKRRRVRMKR